MSLPLRACVILGAVLSDKDAAACYRRQLGKGDVRVTMADIDGALAIAAERPEPLAPPGLVKRLFEWVRERVEKMLGRLRSSQAAQHPDRAHPPPGGDVQPAPAAAAERERRVAGKLIAAAQAAALRWGDVPLATWTVVSVAESLSAQPP